MSEPLPGPLKQEVLDLLARSREMSFGIKAGLALAAVAPAALPSVALGDAYLVARQPQLAPVKSGPHHGPTPQAVPADGTFQCSVTWATVANAPSGFATGNCASGTHLHRTLKSDPTDTGYYDGGEIFGNYAGCGWIGVGTDSAFNTTDHWANCYPYAGYNQSDITLQTDGCSGTSSCSGTPFNNPANCQEYGNYRPWLSGQNPTDPIRKTTANTLSWRYFTKYAAADGSGQYVMVRDRNQAAGSGNWVFVQRSCLGI
ncbi:MAG: hypothetical protein JWN32_1922 [Solirubrobacterales bacterium]|nr:hypothetical protein [Solirubrobacterales bacterium]